MSSFVKLLASNYTTVNNPCRHSFIWRCVYLASILAEKTKLTPVLFYLAFFTLLVNTGLLPLESTAFIKGFSEVGLILIMFSLGFEEDTSNFIQGIKQAWASLFSGP